jgi:hypothetical protein
MEDPHSWVRALQRRLTSSGPFRICDSGDLVDNRCTMPSLPFLWSGPGLLSLAGLAVRVYMLLGVVLSVLAVAVAVPTSLMPL